MIPGIPSMGGAELLIRMSVSKVIFGAKCVPALGRSSGISIKEFRKGPRRMPTTMGYASCS